MECPKCGNEIEADSKFCRHCGANVGRLYTEDEMQAAMARARDEQSTRDYDDFRYAASRASAPTALDLAANVAAGYLFMRSMKRLSRSRR